MPQQNDRQSVFEKSFSTEALAAMPKREAHGTVQEPIFEIPILYSF